jgi:glycerol-3-phosphate dehydrogenase
MNEVTVVVVGGGATGVGVFRDLCMRGVKTLLVEQGDLASGTSGRFHGLLHSGGRYAVKDNLSAQECIQENTILRRVARLCLEETEGFFVRLQGDGEEYERQWVAGCEKAGIPAVPVSPKEALALEPHLSPRAVAVYRVPDSAIDGFRLCWQNVASGRRHGGAVRSYTQLIAIDRAGDHVTGVRVRDLRNGREEAIACDHVVNAAGSWVGEVAALAGIGVNVKPDRGVLLAFNHRFTNRVVNRLRAPSNGDIFVPHGTATILGTTSSPAARPDDNAPRVDEVLDLMRNGRELFPDLDRYRILRAYAGTRPLYSAGEGRAASRTFTILDHSTEGLNGFSSVAGGKLTSYRLMAEKAADLVCQKLGVTAPCRTAQEPLVDDPPAALLAEAGRLFPVHGAELAAARLGEGFAAVVERLRTDPGKRQLVCECELVTLAEIEEVARDGSTSSLSDIRRRTRMGAGTCQGAFCSLRGTGAVLSTGLLGEKEPRALLQDFLEARWKGIRPILWGDQLREALFHRAVYAATLNLDGAASHEAQ